MYEDRDPVTWVATTSFERVDLRASVVDVRSMIDRTNPEFLIVDDADARAQPVYVLSTDDFHAAVELAATKTEVETLPMKLLLIELGTDPAPVVDLDAWDGDRRLTGRLMHDFVDQRGVVSCKGGYEQIVYDAHPEDRDVPWVDGLQFTGPAPGVDVASRTASVVRVQALGPEGIRQSLTDDAGAGDLWPEATADSDADDDGSEALTEPDRPEALRQGAPADVTGLQVRSPARAERNVTVTIAVNITRKGGANADIPFEAQPGDTISVVVWPVEGVEIVGADTTDLVVSADGNDRGGRVTVKAVGETRGAVLVQAFRGQTELGSVAVGFAIVEPGAATGPAEQLAVPIQVTDGSGPDSDVALHIVELKHADTGEPGLGFVVIERGQPVQSFGFRALEIDPRARLHELFDLLDTTVANPPKGQIDALVRAIGVQLSEKLLPEELRAYLAAKRGTITSVVVHSDEPTIPWEMCRLTRTGADGRIEELGYLCEEFALTRWLPKGRNPAPQLTMGALGYIAPNDAGLPAQKDEIAMLEGLATAEITVTRIKATLEAVEVALTGDAFDVIHFSGHGRTPKDGSASSAQIDLAGNAFLIPSMLLGAWSNFGVRQPVVFLNACRSGRADLDLGGLGGWAPYILDAGAAMFVGSHWNVVDGSALTFATRLYEELYKGTPVGDAVRAARLAIKVSGDPTWLAYAVYAPPTVARPGP